MNFYDSSRLSHRKALLTIYMSIVIYRTGILAERARSSVQPASAKQASSFRRFERVVT
jgi:hypothetical protein